MNPLGFRPYSTNPALRYIAIAGSPVHTDAKIRPVPDFLPASDCVKAGKTCDHSINFREDLDPIIAVRFLLQEPPFLLGSHGALIRVREQIISLLVGQDEIGKYSLSVALFSVSQSAYSAVFECYCFEILITNRAKYIIPA